jgi:hypothetical protein
MPKSRGRPKRRGGPASRPRPSPSPSLSALALRDAGRIAGAVDSLDAETWASGALGSAWEAAGLLEREPEAALCRDVARRAVARPSPEGLAAVAALRRLAPVAGRADIDEAFDALSRGQPRPEWIDDPPAEPSDGWRAEDPWGSRVFLFIEYADPRPYTLMAAILEATGSTVESLRLLRGNAAPRWSDSLDAPMPVVAAPADDVLAELAMALKRTDRTIPRPDDQGFVALRALAWARCRAYLPTEPTWVEMPDEERERLITAYFAESGQADNDTTRYLAGLFFDYGINYIMTGCAGMESRPGLALPDRLAASQGDARRRRPARTAGGTTPLHPVRAKPAGCGGTLDRAGGGHGRRAP